MRIMRLKEVIEKTGLSSSTIYNLISQSKFPRQVNLGARSVGWVDTEIEEWLIEKIELRNAEIVQIIPVWSMFSAETLLTIELLGLKKKTKSKEELKFQVVSSIEDLQSIPST